MTGSRRFDAELAGLDSLLGEATVALRRTAALPVAAEDAAETAHSRTAFAAATAFTEHLIDRLAGLLLRLDTATEKAATDLRSLSASAEARRAPRRLGRKTGAQGEGTAPRDLLAHLLAISDRLSDLHKETDDLFEDCYRLAESEAERVTRRAVKLSAAIVEAEHQAGRLDKAIGNLERRVAPETAGDEVAALARDRAELIARRAALTAKQTNLREERRVLAENSEPMRRFLAALRDGRNALRLLGEKLLCDTESRVVLSGAADELLTGVVSSAGFGPSAEGATGKTPTTVEALLDLRRKGALSLPDITRRKSEADAAFNTFLHGRKPAVAGKLASR